jgi:hypothetical protein
LVCCFVALALLDGEAGFEDAGAAATFASPLWMDTLALSPSAVFVIVFVPLASVVDTVAVT